MCHSTFNNSCHVELPGTAIYRGAPTCLGPYERSYLKSNPPELHHAASQIGNEINPNLHPHIQQTKRLQRTRNAACPPTAMFLVHVIPCTLNVQRQPALPPAHTLRHEAEVGLLTWCQQWCIRLCKGTSPASISPGTWGRLAGPRPGPSCSRAAMTPCQQHFNVDMLLYNNTHTRP